MGALCFPMCFSACEIALTQAGRYNWPSTNRELNQPIGLFFQPFFVQLRYAEPFGVEGRKGREFFFGFPMPLVNSKRPAN